MRRNCRDPRRASYPNGRRLERSFASGWPTGSIAVCFRPLSPVPDSLLLPITASYRPVPSHRARTLVLRYGHHPSAYQILNPGFRIWWSAERDAVVGYTDHGRVRVVAGEPVCPIDRLGSVVEEFEAATATDGLRVCYLAAEERLAILLRGSPRHSRVVVGAHPVLHPQGWPERLAHHPSMRQQLNRARNKGVGVAEWSAERATRHPALQRCMAAWLRSRGLPPLHFLVETDTLGALDDRRVFVATRDDVVVGFLVATPVPLRGGWLLEQIVRDPHAPNGTAELLADAAFRSFAASGADYVALGVAPLSERAGAAAMAPWLRRVLAWQRAHGRRFYNFAGLEAFKAKFHPDRWEPVYAISLESTFSLGTLWAIAAAYCGGSPVVTGLKAAALAVRQEVRWALGR